MSLRIKTVLGVAIIEAVLLVILLSQVFRYMSNASEEALLNYADNMSNLFATTTKDAVISYDLASIESFVSEMLKNEGVLYARVLDANGEILAFGQKDHYIKQVFAEDFVLEGIADGIFDTRAEINEGGALYGVVEIGVSTIRISEQITQVKKLGIGIALFEMSLVALFSFVLGIYLTRQLVQLRKAAKRIAEGDLDNHVKIVGKDEVADLASSFNQMMISLKQSDSDRRGYRDKLEKLNSELEARVVKRTQQLQNKNAELEEAYQSLQNAQMALLQSEKMSSLGQMAAGVAHEINNPMAFVKSNLNAIVEYTALYKQLVVNYEAVLLAGDENLSEYQKNKLNEIALFKNEEDFEFVDEDLDKVVNESINGVSRVTEIVQGLKSFSRVDQAEKQDADINSCLRETIRLLENELKYKCKLHTDYGDIPTLKCNPGKLNQVFVNLLNNAGQAIENFGDVFVRTSFDSGVLKISIKDTGKGITPEDKEKLFDPFFTTKPVGEGTGLGLSISHGIIEEHNGKIEVFSELGEGTEFIVTLPVVDESHEEAGLSIVNA